MDTSNKSNKPSIHEDILNKLCVYVTKGTEYVVPGPSEAQEKYRCILAKMKQIDDIQKIINSGDWKQDFEQSIKNIFKNQANLIITRLKKLFQSELMVKELLVVMKKNIKSINLDNVVEHVEQVLGKIKFYEQQLQLMGEYPNQANNQKLMIFLKQLDEPQAKMFEKITLQKHALRYIDESLQEFTKTKHFVGKIDVLITERIMQPQGSLIVNYREMKDSLLKISSCNSNEMIVAKNRGKNEIQLLLENVSNQITKINEKIDGIFNNVGYTFESAPSEKQPGRNLAEISKKLQDVQWITNFYTSFEKRIEAAIQKAGFQIQRSDYSPLNDKGIKQNLTTRRELWKKERESCLELLSKQFKVPLENKGNSYKKVSSNKQISPVAKRQNQPSIEEAKSQPLLKHQVNEYLSQINAMSQSEKSLKQQIQKLIKESKRKEQIWQEIGLNIKNITEKLNFRIPKNSNLEKNVLSSTRYILQYILKQQQTFTIERKRFKLTLDQKDDKILQLQKNLKLILNEKLILQQKSQPLYGQLVNLREKYDQLKKVIQKKNTEINRLKLLDSEQSTTFTIEPLDDASLDFQFDKKKAKLILKQQGNIASPVNIFSSDLRKIIQQLLQSYQFAFNQQCEKITSSLQTASIFISNCENLIKKLDSIKLDIRSEKQKRQKVQEELRQLQEAHQTINSEAINTNQKLNILNSQITDKSTTISSLKAINESYMRQIQDLQASLQQAKQDLINKQLEFENLKHSQQGLKNEEGSREAKLQENIAEIAHPKLQITKLENILRETSQITSSKASEELQNAFRDLEELKTQYSQAKLQLNAANSQVTDKGSQIQNLKSQIQKQSKQIISQNRNIKDLKLEMQLEKSDYDNQLLELETLKIQLSMYNQNGAPSKQIELSKLNTVLEERKRTIEHLEDKNRRLNEQILSLKKNQKQLNEYILPSKLQNERLQSQNRAIAKEISELKDILQKKQIEIQKFASIIKNNRGPKSTIQQDNKEVIRKEVTQKMEQEFKYHKAQLYQLYFTKYPRQNQPYDETSPYLAYIDKLFQGELLQNSIESKYRIVNQLLNFTRSMVEKTRLLYRLDLKNKVNFHEYIDSTRNLLCVTQTEKGFFVAGYYSGIYADTVMIEQGLLISVSNNESYYLQDATNQKSTLYRGMVYDQYFLIFGNAQLRIRAGESKLFSNFGIMNSYYNSRLKKVVDFIGDTEREVPIKSYEIYEVIFKEENRF